MENGFSGGRYMNFEQAKRLVGLKSTAYKEYLAARLLFNTNFLQQAVIFANSCIEKEMKTLLISMDVPVKIKHQTSKLYDTMSIYAPRITEQLNRDFLERLTHMYRSRYYEGLGVGYSYVIIKNKFLAELDFTFSILEPKTRWKIEPRDTSIPETSYERGVKNKDPILFSNNYLLNGNNKTDFLNQPDLVYEFSIAPNHEIFETLYSIPRNVEHDRFQYIGNNPASSSSYKISHPNSVFWNFDHVIVNPFK